MTAAIVERSISASKEDNEFIHQRVILQTSKYMPVLKGVFFGGWLSTAKRNISHQRAGRKHPSSPRSNLPHARACVLDQCHLRNAFELIDDAGDGKVDLTEFVRASLALPTRRFLFRRRP